MVTQINIYPNVKIKKILNYEELAAMIMAPGTHAPLAPLSIRPVYYMHILLYCFVFLFFIHLRAPLH